MAVPPTIPAKYPPAHPPYPRIPRAVPRRWPERKRMTIAIGILCQDGIVIAADTEEVAGYMKSVQSKIMTILDSARTRPRGICAIAGAGHAGYIDALTEEIGDVFLNDTGVAGSQLKKTFGRCISDFYRENVVPFAAYPIADRPSVELLIAVTRQHQYQLFQTDQTTIRTRVPHAAIGVGAPFAKVLLDRFWSPRCDTQLAQMLAVYVIYMVKEHIPDCGKFTDVTTLHGNKLDTANRLLTPELDITHVPWGQVDRLERLFMTEHAVAEREALWTFMLEHAELVPPVEYVTPSFPEAQAESPRPVRRSPKRGRKGQPPSPE